MDNEHALKDFFVSEMSSTQNRATDEGIALSLAYINLVLDQVRDTNVYFDPKVFYWAGKTSSRGDIVFYGYDYDETSHTFSLFSSDFDADFENGPHVVGKTLLMDLAEKASRFVTETFGKDSSIFKSKLDNDALDLYELLVAQMRTPEGINKINLTIFTNGQLSSRMKELPQKSPFSGIDLAVQVWDIERIFALSESSQDHESKVICAEDYPELNGGIPCVEIPQDPSNHFKCYLGYVPGLFLANIYRKYGSTILEGNVRSFLSTTTSVNKNIQSTINKEPAKFFVYNNGIAVTSSEVVLSPDRMRIVSVRNFQIINGGQTTASLAYAALKTKSDLSKISVQMKLTEIGDDNQDEYNNTIQAISHSSNSQNKVSEADFFANHPFHVEMEKIAMRTPATNPSDRHLTYWFYERSKGSYKQKLIFQCQTTAQKNDFKMKYSKDRLVTKLDFAKYYNTWKEFPDQVSKGANTNFIHLAKQIIDTWDTSAAKYNAYFFKEVIAVAIMFRWLEKHINVNNPDTDWYNGGYRANIITYALSSLFYLIRTKKDGMVLDLVRIWNEQDVPTCLARVLLCLSRQVFDIITGDRDVENVTQWCKRSKCWQTVKERIASFSMLSFINPYLIDSTEAEEASAEATMDQKQIIKDSTLISVFDANHPIEAWQSLLDFCNDSANQRVLRISEESPYLKSVHQVVRYSQHLVFNLTSVEQKRALLLWKSAEDFGWKPDN